MSRIPHIFSALLLPFLADSGFGADPVSTKTETRKVIIEDALQSKSAGKESTKSNEVRRSAARVLFITAKDSSQSEKELHRLNKSGGDFDIMRLRGWRIGKAENDHIQIIDRDEAEDIVSQLQPREFPCVACIEDGEIVRSFKDGCTTPLDAWTFGWLIKGVSERPAGMISEVARVETTNNYRLRGNHWTLEGDPNPSKQAVINHLRGPNHGHASGGYGAIESWSYEELRSLHDDLHEREGGTAGVAGGQFAQQPAAANRNLDAFSGNRKVTGR